MITLAISDIDSIVTAAPSTYPPEEKIYTDTGQIRIIEIAGELSSDYGFFSKTVNPDDVIRAIATTDRPVVIKFNTRGGDVSGIREICTEIEACEFPVFGYVTGDCLSAGYWIGSACEKLYAAATAFVGGVGSVVSVAKKSDDTWLVEFVSENAPLKRADPESAEGAEIYQKHVDSIEKIFTKDVAKNRGVSEDDVIQNYGRGGRVIAADALAVGMIDGVSSFRNFIGGIVMSSDFEKALEKISTKMDALGEKITTSAKQQEKPDVKTPEEIRLQAINETVIRMQKMTAEMRDIAQLSGVVSQDEVVQAIADGKTLDEFRQYCLDKKTTQQKEINSAVNPDKFGSIEGFGSFDFKDGEV